MFDPRERDRRRLEDVMARGELVAHAIVEGNKPSFSSFLPDLQSRLQSAGSLDRGTSLNPDHLAVPQVAMREDVALLFRVNNRLIVPTFIVYDASGIPRKDRQVNLIARSQETDREKELEKERARWAALNGSGAVETPAEQRDRLWLFVDSVVSTSEYKKRAVPLLLARRGEKIALGSDDYAPSWGKMAVGEHGHFEHVIVVAFGLGSEEPAIFPLAPFKGWRTLVGPDGSFREQATQTEQFKQPVAETPEERIANIRQILGGDSLLALEAMRQKVIEPLHLKDAQEAASKGPNSEIVIENGARHPATVRSTDTEITLEILLTEVAAMQFKKLCRAQNVSAGQLAETLQTSSQNRTDTVTVCVKHVGTRRAALFARFDHLDIGQMRHREDFMAMSPEIVVALFDRLQKPEARKSQVVFHRDVRRGNDDSKSNRRSRHALTPDQWSTARVDKAFEDIEKQGTVFVSDSLETPRKQSRPKSKFERIHQQKNREKAKKQGKK